MRWSLAVELSVGPTEGLMEDVTDVVNAYRECVRYLWNTHFWKEAEPGQNWDIRDGFDEIAAQLFRLLVLRKLGREAIEVSPDYWAEREPLPFLRLEVDTCAEIMVNRGLATGYWDDPLRVVEKGELDLRFLQFFDWWLLGFREFSFYRVRIVGSSKHPHLIGKDALLPVGASVRVLHERAAQQVDEADKARAGWHERGLCSLSTCSTDERRVEGAGVEGVGSK